MAEFKCDWGLPEVPKSPSQKAVQWNSPRGRLDEEGITPFVASRIFVGEQRAAMEGHVNVASQMNQPGEILRTFFRGCVGVCEGLFTLADPVKDVVLRGRTWLNRELGIWGGCIRSFVF